MSRENATTLVIPPPEPEPDPRVTTASVLEPIALDEHLLAGLAGREPTASSEPYDIPDLSRSPCVVVLHGPDEGHVERLAAGSTKEIGRSEDVAIVLHDDGISRQHARITVDDLGRAVIEDLGSRNGTYVGEKRIGRHTLAPDDLIRLGARTVLRFTHMDVLEEELQRKLHAAAVRDPLTGTFNRRHFDERLAGECAASRRHGRPLCFLLADVDNFKTINDRFGHTVGDQVLRAVADRLHSVIRKEDTIFRYGGEEFAVLARETALDGALVLGDRLRRRVADALVEHDHPEPPLRVTISVGVAQLAPGMSDDALLKRADEALYAAKAAGKNRVLSR